MDFYSIILNKNIAYIKYELWKIFYYEIDLIYFD